ELSLLIAEAGGLEVAVPMHRFRPKQAFMLARYLRQPCACRKLHPAILMVKPAQDGQSSELAEPLRLSTAWRILPQGQMRSQFVVVAGVANKDPAQMGLAEDDDVIEAFPADRSDQSLRMPVLPRGPPGRRVIAYAHGCKTLRDCLAVASVTVPDHVLWCFIPRERIGDLAGNPLRRRI